MSKYYSRWYKYDGPTVYTHKAGNPDALCVIYPDTEICAEVNINIATITKVKGGDGICDIEPIDVAAKYLEPIKPEPINFDPDVDVPHSFDDLFSKIAEINAEHKFPFFDVIGTEDWKLSEKTKKELKDNYGLDCKTVGDMQKKVEDAISEQIDDYKSHNPDDIEVGGRHYQTAIQPWDFIYANHIGFDAGCAIKYLCRYEKKGGAEDIKKAISYCKHILKTQYGMDYLKTD